jgi:hypothetical protein
MKIAQAINTYNRITDAKVQMELTRNVWNEESELKDVDIYHGYTGNPEKYKEKYLENYLYKLDNPGHYEGACLLINRLIKETLDSKINYDFIILASADTWILKPKELVNVLHTMKEKNYQLTTSRWFFVKLLSTEFFIITPNFAKQVFPLNFSNIHNLHFPETLAPLEALFRIKTEKVLNTEMGSDIWNNNVYMLPGVENIHWFDHHFLNFYHKPLGHIATHNLKKKGEILLQENLADKGTFIKEIIGL